jgi:hypothetical protein
VLKEQQGLKGQQVLKVLKEDHKVLLVHKELKEHKDHKVTLMLLKGLKELREHKDSKEHKERLQLQDLLEIRVLKGL